MTPLLTLETVQDRPVLSDGANKHRSVIRVSYFVRDIYSREKLGVLTGHIVGRTFFVDDFFGPGKWGLGYRGVRSVVRQLKFDFPVLEHLRGPRLTGARMVSGVVDGSGHARL
jgi:hypothetical protein